VSSSLKTPNEGRLSKGDFMEEINRVLTLIILLLQLAVILEIIK
jgi:hypothetical protein